jgi:hypothetical protein
MLALLQRSKALERQEERMKMMFFLWVFLPLMVLGVGNGGDCCLSPALCLGALLGWTPSPVFLNWRKCRRVVVTMLITIWSLLNYCRRYVLVGINFFNIKNIYILSICFLIKKIKYTRLTYDLVNLTDSKILKRFIKI